MKHIYIQPLKTRWKKPNPFTAWDNNSFFTLSRLLQADAYHIEDPEIDYTADMFWMCSFDIMLLEKEIAFAKKIKSENKKFILSFSQDLRFLLGNCLTTASGIHYGDLCEYADVILSGMNGNWKVFGRFQSKVMEFGLPVERLNFSKTNFENKSIDVLVSNNYGEENWGITTEFLFYLKENLPQANIVYSTSLTPNQIHPKLQNLIKFVPPGLIHYFDFAKIYINLELRPRPGRSSLESFYFRVPFISSSFSYFSKLLPEYSFTYLDFEFIKEKCKILLDKKENEKAVKQAETLMEPEYFDNFYLRLLNFLEGKNNEKK